MVNRVQQLKCLNAFVVYSTRAGRHMCRQGTNIIIVNSYTFNWKLTSDLWHTDTVAEYCAIAYLNGIFTIRYWIVLFEDYKFNNKQNTLVGKP